MQKLQNIHRLLAFVTVIEEGSFTLAANKLHITQPALSARLKLLEEELGCQIFEKTIRGAKVTEIGKSVFDISKNIIERMKNLHTTARNNIELNKGYIHLGGGDIPVTAIFPEAITQFRKKNSSIQFTILEINSHATAKALHDGTIDIGVIAEEPFDSLDKESQQKLTIHFKFTDTLAIIAGLTHPLTKMAQSLKEKNMFLLPMHLNNQQIITLDSTNFVAKILEFELKKLNLNYQPLIEINSYQGMLNLVKNNIGISLASILLLKKEKELQILTIQGLKIQRNILICSAKEKIMSPAALEFINILKLIHSENKK